MRGFTAGAGASGEGGGGVALMEEAGLMNDSNLILFNYLKHHNVISLYF